MVGRRINQRCIGAAASIRAEILEVNQDSPLVICREVATTPFNDFQKRIFMMEFVIENNKQIGYNNKNTF